MVKIKRPRAQLQRHFLREWRKSKNMTQERVAGMIPMSRENLSKIETMQVPYSQGLVETLADIYGCTVADLIVRNPLDKDAPWSLIDSLKRATPEQRRLAVDVVERLLKTGT